MKKKSRKLQKRSAGAQIDPATAAKKSKFEGRRRFLRLVRIGVIALPVIAGAGYFSVQSVQAKILEADLTRVGNGKPSIVQIHDPQCPLCRKLQRQTRSALKNFDKNAFTFLVANIKTQDGSSFAAKYNVPHVTLLLFDSKGEMVEIVRGPSDTDSLRRILAAHLKAYS